MGIFNYIDTFFFISLGITFILILLLVFHFKQRMSDLEEKTETMFEIINNIVKEINSVRELASVQNCCPMNSFCSPSLCAPSQNVVYELSQLKAPVSNTNEKIVVSDDDDDDLDDDDEDSDEDSDKEDSDDGEDSDDEDNMPTLQILESDEQSVKIISVNMGDVIEIDEPLIPEENDSEEEGALVENIQLDDIHVEKIEADFSPEEQASSNEVTSADTSKEIYRKMTLPALKALVITKGLTSDPSKMKKVDLLKLLESANEE
jgi:hypothetical protein